MVRSIAGIITPSQTERFWTYINKTDSCWLWTKATSKHGYGVYGVWNQGKALVYLSHRIAYYLTTGIDPGELVICHRCDNPPCCNPAHLFAGTASDNMADAKDKGRLKRKPGYHSVGNARITEDTVRTLRKRAADGEAIKALAAEAGLTYGAVWQLVKRQTWKHIV